MISITILVVDNDHDSRNSLAKQFLERKGYWVLYANGPEIAEEILSNNLVHLAIVDVRLRNDDDSTDRSGLSLCEHMDPTVASDYSDGISG